jgi:anti-sigma factor RsiW
MDCCEFREKYSDFADGLLSQRTAAEAHRHLTLCRSCRRFEAALREGLKALRELPPVIVSGGFGERLRRRLRWELAVRIPLIDRWSGAVGALLLVVTVGLVAFDLLQARGSRGVHRAAPAMASRSAPAPKSGRIVTFRPPADTTIPPLDAPHPFQPIMIVADTAREPYPAHVRFDVPAAWGGR